MKGCRFGYVATRDGSLRTVLSAGSSPVSAQPAELSFIHLTNVAAAAVLLASWPLLAGNTQCVELDQTAFSVPICGTAAACQSRPLNAVLVVCHTPFQLKAVSPASSALMSPSCATFAGL